MNKLVLTLVIPIFFKSVDSNEDKYFLSFPIKVNLNYFL